MKSFGVLLVALLAVLSTGCGGGDGDGVKPSPVATAPSGTSASGTTPSGATAPSGATTTQPSVPNEEPAADGDQTAPTSRAKKDRSKPTTTREASPKERRVGRYLRENFGGGGGAKAVWYDHVEEVAVSGTTTTVATDLSDDRAGKRLAKQICLDVRGSIPGITDSVRVTGAAGGSTLARCVP